jgi:hypothetical protein
MQRHEIHCSGVPSSARFGGPSTEFSNRDAYTGETAASWQESHMRRLHIASLWRMFH